MVTYMEPKTVPAHMSVKWARRTLRMKNFTLTTHPQPSLSNIPKWDSNFGELTQLLEVYSKPQTGPLPRLLGSYFSRLLAHNFIQKNNYHCYSNIPQLLSAEVVLCTHKTTILCQFGLFCHKLTTISPPILSHFWWELYQINSLVVQLPS